MSIQDQVAFRTSNQTRFYSVPRQVDVLHYSVAGSWEFICGEYENLRVILDASRQHGIMETMTEATPLPSQEPLDDPTKYTKAEIRNRQNARKLIGRVVAQADLDGLKWKSSEEQGLENPNAGVQLARIEGEGTFIVALRDGSDPTGPWEFFTREEIGAVLDGFKKHEFDDMV